PRGRFEPGGVTRILACLRTLLDAMVASPEARLAELPLLGADERRSVLARAAAPGVRVDGESCLHDLVREQAERTPDADALVSGSERLTYADLVRRSSALARRLRAHGVRPETVVGTCFDRSADAIVALLAVLEAGGAYLPLDPSHPRERLAFLVRDAGAAFVLASARHAAHFPAGIRVVRFEDEGHAPGEE